MLGRSHLLHPIGAPRRGLEWVGEVVGLPDDLAVAELADAREVDLLAGVVADRFDRERVRPPGDAPQLVPRRSARVVLVDDQAGLPPYDPLARLRPFDDAIVRERLHR